MGEEKYNSFYAALNASIKNYYTTYHKKDEVNSEAITRYATNIIYSIVGGTVASEEWNSASSIIVEADNLMSSIYQNIDEKLYKRSNEHGNYESMEQQNRDDGSPREITRDSSDNRRDNADGESRSTSTREIWNDGIRNDERGKSRVEESVGIRNESNSVLSEDKSRSIRVQNTTVAAGEQENSKSNILGKDTTSDNIRSESGRDNNQTHSRTKNFDKSEFSIRELGVGAKGRFKFNIEAILLVKKLEEEERQATPEEQRVLAKYVGWGGLAQAFDKNNINWSKEYKELKELLTENEYRSAEESTLSAHYTSNEIIQAIYTGMERLGFKDGRLLEPACGIGNFIGNVPQSFDKKNITGVEIDEITGKIAKQLYPESNIQIKGFEATTFQNGSFDGVITNVPFGAFKVFDREYNKEDLFIHDYFILKSLDKTRANGLCAFITSKGTLDKANSRARKLIAQRAELVGAIRLPNTAFKDEAGTEVTSDILFFQKKERNILEPSDSWIYSGVNDDNIPLNEYFIDNPQMLLGTMKKEPSMYGSEDETTLVPFEGKSLEDSLAEAIALLPENIYIKQVKSINDNEEYLIADDNMRNYSFTVIDNKIYQKINDKLEYKQYPVSVLPRVIELINIKEQVRALVEMQLANCTDEDLALAQFKLNTSYDNFVKRNGFINLSKNIGYLIEDCDYPLLSTIENYNESAESATKSDIFVKRTIREPELIKSVETAREALLVSLSAIGRVDIKHIQSLSNKTHQQVIEELQGMIFKNPEIEFKEERTEYDGWETAEQYLSGNVKTKLELAKGVVANKPEYQQNIDALTNILPEDIPASDISARLGTTWINNEFYEQFLREKFKVNTWNKDNIQIEYNKFTSEWTVKASSAAVSYFNNNNTYGTDRMKGTKILEHCLNQSTINIYDIHDDNTRTLNKRDTALAREKARIIQEEFKSWIFDEPTRRNYLVAKYNRMFNNIVLPKFDGSYLTYPGMSNDIKLRDHQSNAIHRIISSGNALLHHCVGAGKTYTIATAAMLVRQYGIARKPMIVVPNHLVRQWTSEFAKLYPNANLLMATKKDFEKQNRLKFISRVATGDWDAVVIGASSFERIPISQERQEKKLSEEIYQVKQAIEFAHSEDNPISVKNLNRVLKNKEALYKNLMESPKDTLLNFEELGVDYLFVDEAHMYKNKGVFTKMNNVAGIGTTASKRAMDMDMKGEYINELQGGEKGVVFATGTPISNSMTEMFIMQSYLQRNTLKELGIDFFDSWAGNFGETVTALELAPSGNGYRTKTRFAKFTNLPELQKLYRSFADVQTAEMLKLPVPEKIATVLKTPPTTMTLLYNDDIVSRAERISMGGVPPEEDNMLKITTDGKKLALDPRLYDSTALDEPTSKINLCIEKIYDIWEKTNDNKGAQVVFCDSSVPKCSFENYQYGIDFDVYNEIKYKLVKNGIPAKEIRYIHEAGDSDIKKQQMFEAVNNGDIRIIIGSTAKCGAGTNMQKKLYALHHLDTPYRPSDLEQREGRIVRQGNINETVEIFTYVTEKTFDSYSYQILENKQKFISQINKGDMTLREAKDIDEETLNFSEIKAIVTANPLIKRKMELELEIGNLKMFESAFKKNKYALQDKINAQYPNKIATSRLIIANAEQDITKRETYKTNEFAITIKHTLYTDRKAAGEVLLQLANAPEGSIIGQINGFDIITSPLKDFFGTRQLKLKGNGTYKIELSESGLGSIIKMENILKGLETYKQLEEEKLEQAMSDFEDAKKQANVQFEHNDKLKELLDELASVDSELDLDKKVEVIMENASEDNVVVLEPIIKIIHSQDNNLLEGNYTAIKVETLSKSAVNKNIEYRIVSNINNEESVFIGKITDKDTSFFDSVKREIQTREESINNIEDPEEQWIKKLELYYDKKIVVPYIESYLLKEDKQVSTQLTEMRKNIKSYENKEVLRKNQNILE